MAEKKFRFDFALSYAGAQRETAIKLRDALVKKGFDVFYDRDFEYESIGKDGVLYLDKKYSQESRYCIVLISKEYDSGKWTKLEREIIQAGALKSGRDILIPVLTSGYKPIWLLTTRIYFNLKKRPLDELVQILGKKAGRRNPYKQVRPYEEYDKEKFKGRDKEKNDIVNKIEQEPLTLVYGKSGIGKTSLLNAGIIPQLRKKGFFPVRPSLDYTRPVMEQINEVISKEVKNSNHPVELKSREGDKPVEPLTEDETLLDYFRKVSPIDSSRSMTLRPILVLDQFEKIFPLEKNNKNKEKMIEELKVLIEHQSPDSFGKQPELPVVLSMREEYLPQLEEPGAWIPHVDRSKCQLTHLKEEQANEIIGIGFPEEDIRNILDPFYPKGACKPIEPMFVNLLCYHYFENPPQKKITKRDHEKVLEDFYDTVMLDFSDEVKKFIESKLLTEEGKPTQFYLDPLHPLRERIDKLVDRKVLRMSPDGEKIEIIDELLTPIIRKKQKQRKQKRKNLVIAALSIFLAIFIGLTLFAFDQKGRADRQYKNAQTHRLTAEALLEFPRDNTRAIRIAGAAFELGKDIPPSRTCKVLTDIGYSSIEKPFYTTVLHHKESIYTAYFSPDGKSILTASGDGTAKLWDLEGNLKADLNKHTARVFSAVFSKDGDRILTASWDRTAILWDKSGDFVTVLEHDGIVESAMFSGDGKLILTASRDGTARLWDHDGKFLRKLEHEGTVKSAVFSKDDSMVLTASWDKSAKLWRTCDGELLKTLKHNGAVNSAVFSVDMSRIITASSDHTAKLWDREGKKLVELNHNGAINFAVFSADGIRIITASSDHTAKLWNHEGDLLKSLEHNGAVTTAMFSDDGSQILTISEEVSEKVWAPIGKPKTEQKKYIAKIWDINGNLLAELKKHTDKIRSAVFSPDGSRILTASEDKMAIVWTLQSNILLDLKKHKDVVSFAVFSPKGKRILTTSHDYTAILWNAEGHLLKLLTGNKVGHKDIIISAAFSPDGSKIVTASDDGTAKVWDTNGDFQFELKHNGAVSSAVFSPDGSRILTATRDGTANLWNLEGERLRVIRHQDATVYSAVFSPKYNLVLTASGDKTAKLWDLEGKHLKDFQHDGEVVSAVFSSNGRRILTASKDGTAKVWNLRGKLLADLNMHENIVASAVFSPDGSRILTASYDGTGKLWGLKGELLVDLKHKGPVTSAVFSADGHFILTASRDGTAKLWNLDGQLLADLNMHNDIVNYAVFSPDGRRILTASGDKTAKVWLTPVGIYEWLKTAKIPPLSDEDKKKLEIQ